MEEKEIVLNGITLRYYKSGAGKPVLFLHGGRQTGSTFKKGLNELSRKYHVIAPDIPGYGNSSTPPQLWSFKEYAKFFHSFLNKLKIEEVIVIGYSLGGGIAYNLASLTDKVKTLVLIDSAGIEPSKKSELYNDRMRFLFYATHPRYFFTFLSLVKAYFSFTARHFLNLQRIQDIRKHMNRSSSYLPIITTPTVIVWAKDDAIFPVSIAHKLNQAVKKSTLILVEGNHDWPLYKDKEFLHLLTRCLDEPLLDSSLDLEDCFKLLNIIPKFF